MGRRDRSSWRTWGANPFALGVLSLATVGACNAFPDGLRDRIPAVSGDDDGGRAPIEVRADLLSSDGGGHLGLAVIAVGGADWLIWSSTEGSGNDVSLRACQAADCAAPMTLTQEVCTPRERDAMTGYLASAGNRVLATNLRCAGWVCAFDPSQGSEPVGCGFGSDYYRPVGDAAEMFGTVGSQGDERAIQAFDPSSLNGGNRSEGGRVNVSDMAQRGGNDLAVSPARVYFTVAPDATTFAVRACNRPLRACDTPDSVVTARPGKVTALAATDEVVLVAQVDGLTTKVVRVDVGGAERVLSETPTAIASIAHDDRFAYWFQGAALHRLEFTSGALAAFDLVPASPTDPVAVSHLALSPDGRVLYALSSRGLHRITLPPP